MTNFYEYRLNEVVAEICSKIRDLEQDSVSHIKRYFSRPKIYNKLGRIDRIHTTDPVEFYQMLLVEDTYSLLSFDVILGNISAETGDFTLDIAQVVCITDPRYKDGRLFVIVYTPQNKD